jgi:hypothetical protein
MGAFKSETWLGLVGTRSHQAVVVIEHAMEARTTGYGVEGRRSLLAILPLRYAKTARLISHQPMNISTAFETAAPDAIERSIRGYKSPS